jgi:valyl-tRNA synthetase
MSTELSKSYDPTEVEPRWYATWLEMGYFRAQDTGDRGNAFCIVIPPPNVTGSLHMGHALTNTIQDALTRVARMRGRNTLWLPGTDHAGIATQVVVERLLKLEGTDRHALGRERFLERVWQWKGESGGRIYEQLKVIGSSLDWDRVKFTMDPDYSRAVREAFVRLYEEGLIYRANRLINWCVSCRSVISDLEVDRDENASGELFSFAYPFADGSGEIVVATTRPETILGDTAVAVHPDDPRYKDAIGKRLKAPFHDRTIPVIADAILVDPKFGTGAVKVTPAHDFNDFETGKRHGLEEINILNPDGTLNAQGAQFAGMDRFVARKAVKKALEEMGLARGSKPHKLAIGKCSRSGDVLEPILSKQWYVKTRPLAEPAIQAVEDGRVTITPEEWTKTYMHWMTNIQDWCISRQLWWGHQIPAWNCGRCGEATVAREAPAKCAYCGASDALTQDPDVLDTWFSSALWPMATLGWPDATRALETFYPTSVMETGYDILVFWVARMMMFGMHFMKDVPFRKVLLHGMVCDENGEKMSKVKGNVIDPLDLVHGAPLETLVEHASPKGVSYEDALKKFKRCYPAVSEMGEGFPAFGADAVRFYLATNPPQATRINLQLRQMERARNFANKIWNATRFALPYLEPLRASDEPLTLDRAKLSLADRWIVSRLAVAIEEVNRGLDEFRLDESTGAARRFFWDELCDWYLELSKPVFASGSEAQKDAARRTLATCLETAYRLLHPFMPFITEEVWQKLPPAARARRADGTAAAHLMVAGFPRPGEQARDEDAEAKMAVIQGVIVAARNIRGELGIKPRDPIVVRLRSDDVKVRDLLKSYEDQIRILTIAKEVIGEPIGAGEKPRGVGFAVAHGIEVLVPLAGLIDPNAEAARLEREIAKAGKDVEKLEKQLANPAFVERAPAETVAQTRAELGNVREKIRKLRDALETVREAAG